MKTTILKKISITITSVALLAATTVGPTFAQSNQSNQNMHETYRVNISPLNNSGVNGYAMIHKTGDQYTVKMHVSGFEPNQTHVQHIHGFTNGSISSCPTMAQNTDGDSTISLVEGATTYGPILQPLTPFQMTGSNGMQTYNQTFTVNSSDPTMNVLPLGNREIVLHGKTVAANEDLSNPAAGYDATLPVACGHIVPMFNGSGNGSDNGNGNGNDNGQGQNGSSISIEGNGAGSQNNVDVHSSSTTRISQNNDTSINNNVSSHSNTGNNRSSFNTGGGSMIHSGSTRSTISIFNGGGMNMLSH